MATNASGAATTRAGPSWLRRWGLCIVAGATGLLVTALVWSGTMAALIANSPRSFWVPWIWQSFALQSALCWPAALVPRNWRLRSVARGWFWGALPAWLATLPLVYTTIAF